MMKHHYWIHARQSRAWQSGKWVYKQDINYDPSHSRTIICSTKHSSDEYSKLKFEERKTAKCFLKVWLKLRKLQTVEYGE